MKDIVGDKMKEEYKANDHAQVQPKLPEFKITKKKSEVSKQEDAKEDSKNPDLNEDQADSEYFKEEEVFFNNILEGF